MAPLAIATDGGGSIRQPASFNGVVGFKASAGLVPIYPPSRFAPIGHLGPMARTVEDVALLLDAIAGVDPRAEASLERSFAASCTGDLAGYRIGYSSTVNGHAVDREVGTVVENWLTTLSDAGASVEPIELAADGFEETWEALYLFATMKLYETLSSEAKAELSADFLAFIDKARNVTNEAAMRAELRRHDIVRQVFQATQYFDLVVTPTTPTVAFPAGRQELLDTHNDAYAGTRSFRLTQLWNLTGQPALSLPVGWTTAGMPVGAQIIGHLNEDALVLRAAKAGERPLNRRPAL
jgi:aspartyl-tRNA(Asn)/glutamyl-tRNA(Gln) amidotransferase subunit A